MTKSDMLRKQYQKELKNLKQRIRRAEKAGYSFDSIIPNKPKRVTQKTLERLRNIRGDVLYKKAQTYTSPLGEILSKPPTSKEKRRIERESKKYRDVRDEIEYGEDIRYINDEILRSAEEKIDEFDLADFPSLYVYQFHAVNRDYAKAVVYNAIADDGRDAIAQRLNSVTTATEINSLIEKILYASDANEVQYAKNRFTELLLGRALSLHESEQLEYANEDNNWGVF